MKVVSIKKILNSARYPPERGVVDTIKSTVYDQIIEHIEIGGFSDGRECTLKEADVSDVALHTI